MSNINFEEFKNNSVVKNELDEQIKIADNPYLLFKSNNEKILFDDQRIVPKPPAIISIDETTIATMGNIITFLGQSKAGKSAIVSGIIAGMINQNPINVDTLGFKVVPNSKAKAIIHFDTEQSYFDWHKNQKKIIIRSKLSEKPNFYNSVFLRTKTIPERIEIIQETCKVISEQFQGIHAIFIDGIADLVHSVNDEKECYAIIDTLLKLSHQYKTIIVSIIHLNPGATEKARGHLGSHLNRKSESILSVTKEKGGDMSRIKPFMLRNGGASDTPTIEFMWDKDKKQHSFIGFNYADSDKEPTKKEVGIQTIVDILEEHGSLLHTKLKKLILEETGVSESTAKRAIIDATKKGIIKKSDDKKYRLFIKDKVEEDEDDTLPF